MTDPKPASVNEREACFQTGRALWEVFEEACDDNGTTPSDVLCEAVQAYVRDSGWKVERVLLRDAWDPHVKRDRCGCNGGTRAISCDHVWRECCQTWREDNGHRYVGCDHPGAFHPHLTQPTSP